MERLLDDYRFGVFKPFERPAVKPDAADTIVGFELILRHAQDAGLTGTPVPVHTNGDGGVRRILDELHNRFGDRAVVQQVRCGFLVVQKHCAVPRLQFADGMQLYRQWAIKR